MTHQKAIAAVAKAHGWERIGEAGAMTSFAVQQKGSGVQEDARAQLGLARLRCVAISVSVLARADA